MYAAVVIIAIFVAAIAVILTFIFASLLRIEEYFKRNEDQPRGLS